MRDQHDARGRAEPPRLSHAVPSAADRVAAAGEVAGADLLRPEDYADAQPRPDAGAELRRRDHGRCCAGRVRLQEHALDLHPAPGRLAIALEGGELAGEGLGGEDLQRVVVLRDLLEP